MIPLSLSPKKEAQKKKGGARRVRIGGYTERKESLRQSPRELLSVVVEQGLMGSRRGLKGERPGLGRRRGGEGEV